jgi:hypothetical protein
MVFYKIFIFGKTETPSGEPGKRRRTRWNRAGGTKNINTVPGQ